MIFHKWENVWNYKETLYIIVDDNYKVPKPMELGFSRNVCDFSEFNINKHCDFVDMSHYNLMLYIAYRREGKDQNYNTISAYYETYIFMKYKFYNFSNHSWSDEMGNIISQYNDIWYDPFAFVKKKDLKQAIRYLKLKKLNDNKIFA